jgi:hypothetical protein
MRLPIVGLASLLIAAVASVAVSRTDVPLAQTRPDRAALERELAAARVLWASKRPANYEFVLNIPLADSPWDRRFGIFRVTAGSSATIGPLTGSMAPLFQGRTTVEALFDLVAERIAASSALASPSYDEEFGNVTSLFSPDYREVSFEVPVWRAFAQVKDVREPFVLVQHVNHCGFIDERTSLSQCPSYSIAMWGDGTVVYEGGAGVLTLGRRQHQVNDSNVRDLSRAIADSRFFAMADAYSRDSSGGFVDHSAEKWITIRVDGQQKTVHDFYGAPEALTRFEAAFEKVADSRRYTGRPDTHR